MKEIIYVTHNKGKIAEAKKVLRNISFKTYNYELEEPRSEDLQIIAKAKVLEAYELVKKPCIALDSGFFIEELNGFPKAFVNFTLETIGLEGYLNLMKGKKNRNCCFKECLAYHDGSKIHYFYGEHKGMIAEEILGEDTDQKWSDLWYLFIPNGYTKTLAQMTNEERMERKNKQNDSNSCSALQEFAKWYRANS